ncbi:FIST signal transduction protein [Jidongwangia harbinensis]|uniref:FIST signal transduction protein n=1 Tax=Jidongwangia harbinensis TaxID=2878561 RepID=UPI001CD9EFB4|nr:FIST N-terminal domain-containing protein [Jidongwangia harbinensis]MCA2212246.1 FIST C-terminal domain-containing protein [Jidongwangia harbinensis]
MRKLPVGSGTSSLDDATAAGTAAAHTAMAGLNGADPGLVIVYASIRYDLTELLAAVRAVTGDTPLVGATTAGQFSDGEFLPPGTSVSVLVLGAGVYRFATASVGGISADTMTAGHDLARQAVDAAGPEPTPHGAVLVLADGMAGDMQGLLTGIYRVTGAAVPVVGGAAGDDRTFSGSFVLHDDKVIADGAVAVWIGSDRPLHVVSGHGWQAHGLPMLVTRVEGQVVHEIDGRPAAELYNEAIRSGYAERKVPEGARGDWFTKHSFGLIEPDGTQLIRGGFLDDEGQVRTFTPLPEYCAVQIVSANPDDLLDISEQVVADALSDLDDAAVMLTFSCIARMDMFTEREDEEAVKLQKAAGPVSTFGFYTYGEFARTTGVAGYHNATITALAL